MLSKSFVIHKQINNSLVNRKFCNFVVSNGNCSERNLFFEKLSKYKKVDSGGRFLNNIGKIVDDKVKFQSEYKFSIAFENNAYRPGHSWYITEKIMQPMVANSIPIYQGADQVGQDFNTQSFVNYHDFNSMEKMIEYIIELDQDDAKYLAVLNQPWFSNNEIPENNKIESIQSFLYKIFE